MHSNDDPEITNFVLESTEENPDVPSLIWDHLMFRYALGLQNWVCDGHVDYPRG